eukprot:37329-Pyramimonas_sp.AAC.1
MGACTSPPPTLQEPYESPLWALLERSWAFLGPSWGSVGLLVGLLGATLALSCGLGRPSKATRREGQIH